jgi:hypothetical protein
MPTIRSMRSSCWSRGTRPNPKVPVGPVTATVSPDVPAVDLSAVDLVAVDVFFAVDLFAVDLFFAVDFLAVDFLAVDFFAADFLLGGTRVPYPACPRS